MKHSLSRLDNAFDWRGLPAVAQGVIEQAVAIQQIPAPTFHERERAAYIAAALRELRLEVATDDLHNVYARLPGKNPHQPAVMLSAHTDTVFTIETDLRTRVENGLIYGPGLGDNSIGVAALPGMVRLLRTLGCTPDCDIWLAATTREEGIGDLGGMKAAFQRLRDRIKLVINIEGMALGHVYRAGIAVRRLHITAAAEGGHSWLNFGRPSAVHGIVELGARLLTIRPSSAPRATYNIGLIEGGQSINTIAREASMWLDLRAEDTPTLAALEHDVRACIAAADQPDLHFTIEVVGDRPAGAIAPEHPLVQAALAALAQVGLPGKLENGSTDANIPLAAGHPAVTVGITRGGNAHRPDEYIETAPVSVGLRQLALLTLTACADSFR